MSNIAEAKAQLPLPQLMARIGDGDHAKKSARCPFHEDGSNSFSVYQTAGGGWLWKCHSGCGTGDGVDYLSKRFGLSIGDAIGRYCREAGVNGSFKAVDFREASNWRQCLAAFKEEQRSPPPESIHKRQRSNDRLERLLGAFERTRDFIGVPR